MPIALGLLVLVGLLVAQLFQQIRINNDLAIRNHFEAQRGLMVASALAHAQSILDAADTSDLVVRAVRVELDSGGIGYRFDLEPWGALVRLTIHAVAGPDSVKPWFFDIGSSVDPDSFPEIGIFGGGGVSLGSKASLLGRVWARGVVKNDQGGAPQGVVVRADRNDELLRAALPLRMESEWLDKVERLFRSGLPLDSALALVVDKALPIRLGGVVGKGQYYADSMVLDGLRAKGLVLVARRIVFHGTNECEDCLLQALQDVELGGRIRWTGQILARDSLVASVDSVLGSPICMVQGRFNPNTGKKESVMRLERGFFTGWWGTGTEWGYASERMVRIQTGREARIRGVISSGGLAAIKGELSGAAIVSGVARFDQAGILWEGGLDSAKIRPWPDTMRQMLPWTPTRPATVMNRGRS